MVKFRLLWILVSLVPLKAEAKPVSYQSCGETFLLKRSPQRAISMDINTTEIMLALGLAPYMIGSAGVRDGSEILPELREAFARVPKILASYPGLDTVIGKRPDFIFGGWQYGFSESTGLTPQRLRKFGIPTYALNESCIRIQQRDKVQLEDVFADIETIGHIFDQKEKARELIHGFKAKLASFPRIAADQRRIRVFLYDSGEASPYTAGRFAMPQAMMEAAGAANIFEDIPSSWTAVSWEAVIARKPEFIIIVDYGDKPAADRIRFLTEKFRRAHLDVMSRRRFLVLDYAAVTPGIRTVSATEQLIQALHQHFPRPGT
jgi:iron complex transport system substrate-binding protein